MSQKCTYKIIIYGRSSAGNGALINRYVNNLYLPGEIGSKCWNKKILVDGSFVSFQLYDAVCNCFRFGKSFNYYQFNGIIIIFDVAKIETFFNVSLCLDDIIINAKNDLEVILVGDRSGDNRAISKEDAANYAAKYNIHYFDISIKDNEGIDDAFTYISTQIHHHNIYKNIKTNFPKKLKK